jgi:isopenicillin-N epimerase
MSQDPRDWLAEPVGSPDYWMLERSVVFLNHGSFGSCPRPVLEYQRRVRDDLERQPVRFLVRELEARLEPVRRALGKFLDAEPDNLVFVPNATAGVNTVLRSLRLAAGDELLVTNHEYNACRNALEFVAAQWGAKVIEAPVPFPFQSISQIREAILSRVTSRTRLALLDHVTSQTGVVMPIAELVKDLARQAIEVLVDGAHAPGMVPLRLRPLGATYYTGNCHKWLCAPKSAAFLYVRPEKQHLIRPLSISHGANSPRRDRSRFQVEFGWTGTWDPSALLSVPEAIRRLGGLLPGGWPDLMGRNRQLALAAREVLLGALKLPAPCPDDCIGSLASVPLPDAATSQPPSSPLYLDPLQDRLLERHHIEVPVIPWPASPRRLLRISAQLYNSLPQYERLAKALRQELS